MQMKDIKTRPSKFGDALVITASPKAGGYVLGFQVNPDRKALDDAFKEIDSLHKVRGGLAGNARTRGGLARHARIIIVSIGHLFTS